MTHLEAALAQLQNATPASKSVRFTVSVDAAAVAVLDRYADRAGRSRSDLISTILTAVAADLEGS